MVWFQCEDCGENLKKPKLANHFRGCSARKLSCIDCGVVFDQVSVQHHTSCVTEAEKYGPKGTVNNKNSQKLKSAPIQKTSGDLDLKHGLSTRPPWGCSLCNVKATSEEALGLHSEGRKHRNKVKAAVTKAAGNGTANLTAEETISAAPARDEKQPTEQFTVLDAPVPEKKKRKSDQHETGGAVQPPVSRASDHENAAGQQAGGNKLNNEGKKGVDSAPASLSGAADDKATSSSHGHEGEVDEKKHKKSKKRKVDSDAGTENGDLKDGKSTKEGTGSHAVHNTGTNEIAQSNEGISRKSKNKNVEQADGLTRNGSATHAEAKSKFRKSKKRKDQSGESDPQEVPKSKGHRQDEAVKLKAAEGGKKKKSRSRDAELCV